MRAEYGKHDDNGKLPGWFYVLMAIAMMLAVIVVREEPRFTEAVMKEFVQ